MGPGDAMDLQPDLETRQRQFNAAMERYEQRPIYRAVGKAVSVANVSLQAYLAVALLDVPLAVPARLAVLSLAYVVTDFVNGLVHMLLDGMEGYESPVGPLVAAFHLHHRTPVYRRANLAVVYFSESGAKLWLVGYLAVTVGALRVGVPAPLAHLLVYVGILSSVAEVSHYLCHTVDARWVRALQRAGLLLSRRHHARHHRDDNVNYAFLNGLTDPVLNAIARRLGRGYKRGTDLHYATYLGAGTANR